MKKIYKKIISVIMCIVLIGSTAVTGAYAIDNEIQEKETMQAISQELVNNAMDNLKIVVATTKTIFAGMSKITSTKDLSDNVMKVLYNTLNVIVDTLVKGVCNIYPDPADWTELADKAYDYFLEGRSEYRTQAQQGNYWSLGYASESVIPEDIDSGRYNIGRELLTIMAKGVFDDQRIRIAAIDDNSGEGLVIMGALDCLGITSTDVREVRKGVIEYCEANNIKVSSINISATHCHTALDTQGVSTQFFYKLFAAGINNKFKLFKELPFTDASRDFKNGVISKSIKAAVEAIEDMEKGSMYYGTKDCSYIIKDKRDLIAKEDIPETVTLYFTPDSGSEDTYISNVSCHPTSFSASNELVSSDYIYFTDQYIREHAGANFLLVQGALGQLSRDNMGVHEGMGAETKYLGEKFGEYILDTEFSTELTPLINVHHKELYVTPQNYILQLACEIKLVNNKCYYNGDEVGITSELGYLEFGHKVGFAMFPGEFYPETFWGTDITGGANWDGTEWQYGSMHNSVDGVDVYPMSLTNDAIGYVVPDNYFAFMGHIIGEGVADETLSTGKHAGSYLISSYLELLDSYVK